MAWIVENAEDSTQYDLYIGGDGKVIANANSSYLFKNFSSLTTINFGNNFDTSNTTNMRQMFQDCSVLTSLDVGNFDTHNVTDMGSMFYGCSSLTSLDVSNFDTSNVTDMAAMFMGCEVLTDLNLNNFNTNKTIDMHSMFNDCSSLVKLNLCSFDTSKVTDMQGMFENTSQMTAIIVGSLWTMDNVASSTNMFAGSGVSSVTLSNNCEVDAENIKLEVSTTSTTNGITVVANARANSGIAKYEYSKDGGTTWETGTSNTHTFTGLSAVANSISTLKNKVVTMGDGLYADENESGRYFYRGSNPNNYITFNNEIWRIISIESDGTIKILKSSSIGYKTFDSQGLRDSSSNGAGGTYCANSSDGCNAWTVNDNFVNGGYSGTVLKDAELNTYLNEEYYNGITDKDKIDNHDFSVGPVTWHNNDLAAQITSENSYKWNGKVGLITVSEYLRANSNQSLCGTFSLNSNNSSTCESTNWMISSRGGWWTLSPDADFADRVMGVDFGRALANRSSYIRPTLYLSSDITLSGTGTNSDPYVLGMVYPIKVRVTSNLGNTTTSDNVNTALKPIAKPTFTEKSGSGTKTVTINYPEGCGNTLTCTYQKDNGTVQNVTGGSINIEFSSSGSLVATVTDGTNIISSSYTITVGKTSEDLKALAVTSGDGLYADENESGRYLYKGSNPNNYVTFNDEIWRIISIESDGTIKLLRNNSLGNKSFDSQGLRDSSSNGAGGTYCANGSYGCNAWAVNDNFVNGSYSGTVLKDAELNTYLNGEYYNGITDKDKIVSHNFSVGGVTYNNNDLAGQITSENSYKWNGKVGLITASEYIRANSNVSTCGTLSLNNSNYSTCKSTNWMFNGSYWWTLSPYASNTSNVWYVDSDGTLYHDNARGSSGVRPALYLSSDTTLRGEGSSSDPFTLE